MADGDSMYAGERMLSEAGVIGAVHAVPVHPGVAAIAAPAAAIAARHARQPASLLTMLLEFMREYYQIRGALATPGETAGAYVAPSIRESSTYGFVRD